MTENFPQRIDSTDGKLQTLRSLLKVGNKEGERAEETRRALGEHPRFFFSLLVFVGLFFTLALQ